MNHDDDMDVDVHRISVTAADDSSPNLDHLLFKQSVSLSVSLPSAHSVVSFSACLLFLQSHLCFVTHFSSLAQNNY